MCLMGKKREKKQKKEERSIREPAHFITSYVPLLCKTGHWMLPQSESFERVEFKIVALRGRVSLLFGIKSNVQSVYQLQ